MRRSHIRISSKGFISLLGLVLTLAIITIVLSMLLKVYFRRPVSTYEDQELFSQEDGDVSTHQGILDNTRKTLEDYNKSILEREREIENIR